MNGRGVTTSRGGKWNKSSFHRIFSNRRYLGKYIYHGEEIDGGMPQLIDDELFAEAQKVLAKYAAAPSRGKAKVEYLLSDKMICGHCGNKMTGISSTSKITITNVRGTIRAFAKNGLSANSLSRTK